MSLKKRIRRLQREFKKGHVLTMPDGRMIPLSTGEYGESEAFDALLALLSGEDHRLLPLYREIHEAAKANGGYLENVPHEDVDFAQMLWAINAGAEAAKAQGWRREGDDD